MTSKTFYASLAFVIAITFACRTAQAEDGEFYVNTYRSLGSVSPQGVRSSAMGRAGRGLADGVYSLGVNPAALGAHQGAAIDVALGFDWLDDGYDAADQVTFKLGGAVSLDRWSRLAGPNQAVGALLHTQNYSGASNNSMKRNQTGVLMAYGLHFMENLLGGVSVALFDGEWKSSPTLDEDGNVTGMNLDRSFTGGDFKVGGIYRITDQTTFGGTVGYSTGFFKEKATYAGTAGSGSLERWSIGVGVAHQYTDDTLILGDIWYDRLKTDAPGILDESNKAWGLSVGIEQQVIPDLMALRGGLYYDRTSYSGRNGDTFFVPSGSFSKGRFGVTAGVGVRLYNFDLGYSLDINSNGDVKNTLDVATEW